MSDQRPPSPSSKSEQKQSEFGAKASTEFRQSRAARPLQPHELTAEWTVRAQLTFARAGEKVQREYSTQDPLQPVRVVYKWSTPCESTDATTGGGAVHEHEAYEDNDESTSSTFKQTYGSDRGSTPLKAAPQGQSFRSTNSSNVDFGGADSAFSGSNTSKRYGKRHQQPQQQRPDSETPTAGGAGGVYGTRCRSTCNIIVSAVADFLNPSAHQESCDNFVPDIDQTDPFTFNTTASYTVLPEQTPDASKTFASYGKILALRDAFSQTSDNETKYFEERDQRRFADSRSPYGERKPIRRSYDQRRATAEALSSQQGQLDEANTYVPSYSPTQLLKSASMPRIPPLPGQQGQMGQKSTSTESQQKKPRTVHIDVYCTGSEDEEEHADGEASSTESDENGSNRHELESNSTPQTVLDNEQMLLRHQRVVGSGLPRRMTPQTPSQLTQSKSSDLNLGHAITKSSTADEVSESKQLLFRKHIGDHRAAKLANLRQKYIRQASDDTISSNYPNSSRSTVRDATCSSISSAVHSTFGFDQAGDSSWKETEDGDEHTRISNLTKVDSFDYENSLDPLRISQMERLWSRQHFGQPTEPHTHRMSPSPLQTHLQTITEVQSQRSSPFATSSFQRSDTLPSESEPFSETDGFYMNPGRAAMAQTLPKTLPTSSVTYYQRHLVPTSLTTTQPTTAQLQQNPNRPAFLQFFGPSTPPPMSTPTSAPVQQSSANPFLLQPSYSPHLQRWKSEVRDNISPNVHSTPSTDHSQRSSPQQLSAATVLLRCGSEAPPTTTSAVTFQSPWTPQLARRFDINPRESSVASETSTAVSGYTHEYLEKARIFGKVVAVRKPGHHVGPTKNPNCSCESCQRWLAERFQIRGRAFSLGERPLLQRPK